MFRESLDGGRVKGGVLNAHLEWLDAQKLPAGRSALAPRVSPATARLLETPLLPISWYPARSNLSSAYRFYNESQPHVEEAECVCDGGNACRFEIAWS
jgi:hypothetical protein